MDMIIKSRATGKWALQIFESFVVDRSLPKHYRPPKDEKGGMAWKDSSPSWGMGVATQSVSGGEKLPWWRRVVRSLAFPEPKREQPPHGKMDVSEAFSVLKGSTQKLVAYLDRMQKIDLAIKLAESSGQKARLEHLKKARETAHFESLLIAGGFTKFFSEADIIEFAGRCKKGLSLSWIGNYAGEIPAYVVHQKVDADKLRVFDNYVVLHYDPNGQNFALTQAQIAAKKDPILFGVIEGVGKLYFVADWVNADDDLTMAEVSKVLGRNESEIQTDPAWE